MYPIRPYEDEVTVPALGEVRGAIYVDALLLFSVDRIRDNSRQGPHVLVGRNLERSRARGIGGGHS